MIVTKMKTSSLISLLLLLLFVACDKEQEGLVAPAELIRSISVASIPDNMLRKKVLIDFQKESSFRIEYWKSSEDPFVRVIEHPEVVSSAEVTLLFLEGQTKYTFRVTATHGNSHTTSAEYEFITSNLPSRIYEYSLLKDEMTKELPGYILLTRNEKPGYIAMTDSRGAVVWYHLFDKPVWVATYDAKTQTISCIIGNHSTLAYTGDEIQVIDLYGKVLLSKNASGLAAHHDVRRLPDGNIVVVNYVPKVFDLTSRGGSKTEVVNGDGLTVLNMKGETVWQWDCFSEMSPVDDPNIMGGMGFIQYRDDWLHANSVNYDEQGNFYMTFNWLNQMWKIDARTKAVRYRLGVGGTVKLPETGYTSGIHCVTLLKENEVLFFDNGIASHQSRALSFVINEQGGSAQLTKNIILPPEYASQFMGGVCLIDNEIALFGSTLSSSIIFTDLNGKLLRVIKSMHQSYRADYIPRIDYQSGQSHR